MKPTKYFIETAVPAAIAVMALLSCLMCSAAVGQTLTGHWTFDTDGTDSASGRNATLLNGAFIETPTVGQAFAGSDALRLDGDNDVATISMEALPPGAFTISFWEYTMDTDQAYFVATNDPSPEMFLQRRTDGVEVRGRIQMQLFPIIELSKDAWHHHVITNDDTGGVWYVDGVDSGQMEAPSLWAGGTDPLVIGNRLSDLARGLNGYMDDLQIYSGAADTDDAAWLFANPGETLVADELDGDLNSDGFVGGDDLDIVRSYWGQNVTVGDLLQGDPSEDGFVGGDDLDIVRANWGQGTPPAPTAVPEPATAILLLAGVMGWIVTRRR